MQGYYVAGMYVSGDHLCHANVDVAGFWRNLKKGGRVWVNSFQRNVKGVGNSVGTYYDNAKRGVKVNYTLGKAGVTPMNSKSIYSKAGYAAGQASRAIGTTSRNIGNAANSAAKKAKWVAGVNKTNAKIGYNAGKYGWDRKKLVGNSLAGNTAYAVGRASKHVGDAANAVKEWGGKAIDKAKTFITNLFSKIGNGAKAIPGLVNKAVTTLKTEAPKAIEKGKSFMQSVFEAVGQAKTQLYNKYRFKTGKIGRLNKSKPDGLGINLATRKTNSGRYIPYDPNAGLIGEARTVAGRGRGRFS